MEIRAATQEEVLQAQQAGETPLLPLALDMHGCATLEEMNSNLEATIARGYVSFVPLLDKSSGSVSIVGSGPSLHDTLDELTGDVFAINQAVGFLIDHGIIPKWAMLWDAAECVEQFAVPHPDVTYLVASRCHPKVFERLKGCNVQVWHAGGDHNIWQFLLDHKVDEPMVNGGSAGITRAMFMVDALGYTEQHIFGADSSYGEDGNTHIIKSLVPEKDSLISVGNKPPQWFRTTPEWCAQVNEFRQIFTVMTHEDRRKIVVHGKGMLPCVYHILVAQKKHLGADEFIKKMHEHAIAQQNLDAAASGLTKEDHGTAISN